MEIKIAHSKKEFDTNAKEYVMNMTKNIRTLHKKNNPNCYYSKCFYEYVDFDNLEEVKKFPKTYRKCENCFPK